MFKTFSPFSISRLKFIDHCLRQGDRRDEEKSFSCSVCGKKFALERLLKDHRRAHVNSYRCPHCNMSCPTPSTLASHITYRHTKEKPFNCEFCEYKGKTEADVWSHLRVHYSEVEFGCKVLECNFKCRAKTTLKKHMMLVHNIGDEEAEYSCHICEARFQKGVLLTRHLVGVHSFSLPSGHSRLRYKRDAVSGLLKLQTVRVESLEVHGDLDQVDLIM